MPVDVLVYTTADKEGSPPCMTVTDDTTIKIDAPTEKERVYQKVSSDVDTLANHMAQGITAAIENGAPAGALVYAPSSLFSAQGVLAGSLVEAACGIAVSHGATELRVALLARDQAIDLFHPESDALKLKVNEANGEVQFEGSQAKKPADGAQARAIIEEALKNAEDWCQKKNVERAHCFVVVTCGVVTLMLCAGADRFDCADLSPEGKADLEKKNAYMRQLCQLCSTVGRGDDPRAISWKDSKVTKVLQGPLPAAMESRGYFAFLFLVCNGKRVAIETIDSLNVAECTVRTEGLQTISVYKTLLGHYEEMLDVVQKEKKEYVNEMVQHETHCKQRKDKYDSMVAELNGKVQAVDARIAEAKRKMESDKVHVKKECEKKITEAREKARKEVDDFKKMIQNSTQVADSQIKEKVSKIEQETVTYNRESSSQITKLETEYTTLKAEVERSEERLKEMEAVERKTHAILRPMEKTLLGLRQELAASGKPREEGKSDAELATLRPIWEVRDKVDDMSEKVRLLKIKCLQLDNARRDGIGKPKAYSSSDGSSGSDSDSSDDSSDESSSEDEEELEERRKKKEKESFDREVKQFLTVSRKEHHLVNLLEQILQYLEYGTTLHMLDNIAFRRQFFFISKDRATLHICDMDQNDVPIRKYPNASYPLNQIKELIMGQDTPSFIKAMELSPNHQLPLNRGDTPPEISSLNLVTAPFFFYRSFSIVFQSDVVVDVTAESATDYEAWIVAMHKLTTLDPQWRRGLPVETMDQYTGLLTQEREACRQCHLPPVMYLKFKELILCHPRLYMTLYDVRTLTNIDLLHCQRLFVFFVKQKWIDRYVFYFIHPTNKPEKIAPAGRGVGKKPPGKPGGLPFSPKAVMRKP